MKEHIQKHFKNRWQEFYGKYLQAVGRLGGQEYQALCPFHEDSKPSFNFNNETGTYFCHGCGKKGDAFHFYAKINSYDTRRDFPKILKGIASDFGIPWEEQKAKIVKTYDYTDGEGALLFQVCRMDPKDFRQRRPDGKGRWVWNLKGVNPVLYNLPAIKKAREVLIVEGEKDADNLKALGFTATCNPGGARKWKEHYNEALKGKDIVLIPDNDKEGREHMTQVAISLNGTTNSLKWLELPGLPSKGDVSDFIESFEEPEAAAERLAIMIANADLYGNTPDKKTSAGRKPKFLNVGATLLGLDDLRASFEEKISWLYKEHIPRGMPVIFNGREGEGKTTCCIKIGDEILKQEEGIIIWIASEGFVQDTKDKMERLGVDERRFLLLRNADGTFQFNFATQQDLKQLDAVLSDVKGKGIPILAVFIDSIRGITPYDDLDSRIKNPMMALNGIVCDKYKASLVYIHHLKKGGKDGPLLDRNTGPTAIASSVRAVYSVLPVSAHVRKITLAKTNILGHRPPDLVSVENRGSILIRESTEKTEKTLIGLAEEWLINLFSKKTDYLVQDEIYKEGEKLGFTPDTLKKAKKHLPIEAYRPEIPGPWHWKCEAFLNGPDPYRGIEAPLEKMTDLEEKKSNNINKGDKGDKNLEGTPKILQGSQEGQGGKGGIGNKNYPPCNNTNHNNKLAPTPGGNSFSIRKCEQNRRMALEEITDPSQIPEEGILF